MTQALDASVTEWITALDARELSAVELMERVLERIDASQSSLNTFTSLRDAEVLLSEARTSDERRARGEAGTLEGIPFGAKDLEDVAGLVTSYGSGAFTDNLAKIDSTQVKRLRAAGAIAVGKTNTPEFGYTALTKNHVFGTTSNPWNFERTPGGSSGGSSAAVAGGIIPIATASDGGGSVRIPASCTGTYGLKPSLGRIPEGPHSVWNIDHTSCWGPLTRTVEDAARQLDATCGPHASDAFSLPPAGISYLDTLGDLRSSGRKLRIAFSADLGYAVVQPDIAAIVEDAAKVFESLGHTLVALEGGPPEPGRDWLLLGAMDQHSKLYEKVPGHEEQFGRSFLRGIQVSDKMDTERWGVYRRRRQELNNWCEQLFDEFDLLITPTLPYDPPLAKGPLLAEIDGRPQPAANIGSFTMPFNMSMHPAASMRAGASDAGLPVGLQIVAPRHRDDWVLQASYAFERERPWHPLWPDPIFV
jgi:Asp-tRNA(Asn)/Glu-tRNA(Gln) amidotransferase A subunit family amidase